MHHSYIRIPVKKYGKFCLTLFALFFYLSASSQGLKVHGKVSSSGNQPLVGVTVQLKGTTTGAITDKKGDYTITAAIGDSLIFRYIGYQPQHVAVKNAQPLNIQLEPSSSELNQLVVIGYGTQKKVDVVGAVSSVKVDQRLASRSVQNVSSALEGLAPGLSVTQSSGMAGNNQASLLIRGLGTVNNSSPLIVVDGMPDVDINRLDMNDISSISVLKDATAAAVYGSRAANGVILITTKSGKGKKTTINFTGSYAVEAPVKSYQFLSNYPRALTVEQRMAAVNTLPSNQTFKNGTIDQWMALGMIDPLQYPNTDWWNIIMQNGALQNYNLSASGSGDKSNFYVSIGTKDEDGLQINNEYKQYNARINYGYKVSDHMNAGVKIYGDWSNYRYALAQGFTDKSSTNTAGFDMQYAIAGITPYDPVSGYFGGVMAYNESPQAYNPYTLYINNLNRINRQEVNSNIFWDWTPVKGLTARIDYALNYYNQFRWNANMPNQSYNFQTKSLGSRVYVGDNAGIANYTNTGYKTMWNAQLNYHTTIAENHEVSAMFVYSEEYWYDRYQASSRNDRLYPTLHEIDAALTDIQSTGGNSSTEGLRSYIGRINYTAFNKYLFEGNFRYDGSSKFLPGSQYGFFPSVAVGWRFTEENFLKSLTNRFLSSGKLRVSYGSLGNNSGVDRYEQQGTLAADNYMIGGEIEKGFVNSKMVNKNLSWEVTTILDVGLDLGFFNNRLTASFDYYNRLTTGMLRPSDMSILLTGAYDAPRTNIGNLRNRGVEGDFNWRDKIGQVQYNISLNASYNATVLEKWNEYLGRGTTFLGMPYHFVYSYEDVGIAQTWQDVYSATPQGASPGDVLRKDLNGDGLIDGNDRRAYPHRQEDMPTTFFALNTNFSWKGIDLGFMFQGSAGRWGYWLNDYNKVSFSLQRYASNIWQWEDTWSGGNREATFPRLGGHNDQEQTSFWLYSMRYVRLKNVQLGYELPHQWIRRIGLSSFRLYGSAENLITLTPWPGLDPEIQGDPNGMYPMVKSYSIGINVTL
ncbi:MAG TPA: TonB-dependent receptor [Chitinophagaceae bacterium]|nr:TonB-dependent receptor [Chitinophagaceae bacterium]